MDRPHSSSESIVLHGPKGKFITGVLADYRRDALGFFTSCAREFGDFVPMQFGPKRAFLVSSPSLIDEILVQKYRSFTKGPALRNNRLVFGNGLLTSEGEFWRKQRKLAQPAFHRDRINAYARIMVDCADRRMQSWRSGETLDIHDEMMRITMDIAARTLFGADVGDVADEVAACMPTLQEGVMQRFQSLINLPEWVPTPTHIRLWRVVSTLDRVVYGFIESRRRSGADGGDLLSALLQAKGDDGASMPDKQLRDEVLTLFLAGHETTALALTWTLMLLSQNPEVETVLIEELNSALGGRLPNIDDRARLPYTEAVMCEGMRLYPPAWAVVRTAIEKIQIGGHDVPKGSLILILPWILQRDARWFPDPDAFKLERWMDGSARDIPRHAYMPFGGGPRTCIGNTFSMVEAVMVLAAIVQRYSCRLAGDQEIVLQPAVTLRPKYGLRMTVRLR